MSPRWPSMKATKLRKIVERFCGGPTRREGSHCRYQGKSKAFTFAFHDNATVPGGLVRSILVKDVGLTDAEAREAVGL